jgi:hypothetical protein
MTCWKQAMMVWMLGMTLPGRPQEPSRGAAQPPPAAGAVSWVEGPPAEVMRVIVDAATGDCWLLERGAQDGGGPGRLVQAARGDLACGRAGGAAAGRSARSLARRGLPVIRAGARIVAEEETAVVEAHLEAIALEPGWTGAVLRVRPVIGGRVLHALVLGPGRARIVPESEGWR